jgi:hypothetical protein
MRYNSKLSRGEKLNAWLELCSFTFELMKNGLDKKAFKKRWRNIRKEHVNHDILVLKSLGKIR